MSDLRRVKKIARQKKRHSAWRKAVTCVAALVVFCTTYALILPAITMEKSDYSCGLQAHTHTADCYQLSCGQVEIFSHTHGEDCYDDAGNLICPYPQQTLHHHSADCYRAAEPLCGLEVSEGHTHGETCYDEAGNLVCVQEESLGHTHTDACYIAPEPLCGQEDIHEHRHTDSCYRRICELEAHTHDETCVSSHEGFSQNLGDIIQGNQNSAGSINAATEPVTEPATEATTEPTVEPTTEPTTAPTTEAATEPVTEPTTEASTEEPTAGEDIQEESKQDLAAMMFSLRAVARAATDYVNLTEVTTVNILAKEVSYEDDAYNLKMELAFNFKTEGNVGSSYIVDESRNPTGLQYRLDLGDVQLPNGFGTGIENAIGFIDNSTGELEGIFYFEVEDGKLVIYMIMEDSYVKEAGSNGVKCSLEFKGAVDKSYSNKDGDMSYPGGEDSWIYVPEEDIDYPEGESNLGDINVTKSGTFNYNADGTLSYTVNVSSKNGTGGGNILFTDEITFGGSLTAQLQSVSVDNSISDNYTTDENNKISMTLDPLEAGGSHTITYTYKLDDKTALTADATMVDNTAKVQTTPKDKDGNDGMTIEKSFDFEMGLTKPDKDVNVRKTGAYTYSDGTLTYTVVVTSQNGSPGAIDIHDVLELVDLTATPGNITVTHSGNGTTTTTTWKQTGNENQYTYGSSSISTGEGEQQTTTTTNTIDFELPALGVGEQYVIEYTYTLNDPLTNIPNVASGNAKNTVKVESKDDKDDKTSTSTSTLDVHKPQPSISKSNDWNDADNDKNDGTITWTIVVNEEHVDIAGQVMTDSMTVVWNEPNANQSGRFDGELTLDKVFGQSFYPAGKTSPVSWDENLKVYVKGVNDTDYKLQADYSQFLKTTEDATVEFLTPDGESNTYAYKLVYSTSSYHLGEWGKNSVTNSVEFFGQKAYSKAEEDATGKVTKTNGKVKKADDGSLYIEWTITIDLAKDGLHESSVLYDNSYRWSADEDDYIDTSSLKVYYYAGGYAPGKEGKLLTTDDGSYSVSWLNKDGQVQGRDVTGFAITFTGKGTENGSVGDQAVIIYKTKVNESKISDQKHTFSNYAKYRDRDDFSETDYFKDSFTKTDGGDHTGETTLENLTGELTWKLKTKVGTLSTPTVIKMEDTLPEHVLVDSILARDSISSKEITLTVNDNGEISGETEKLTYSGTLTKGDSGYVLKVNVQNKEKEGDDLLPVPAETEIVVTLKCRVDDELLNEAKEKAEQEGNATTTLKNTAKGSFDDISLGTAEQTQKWTYKKENAYKDTLSKSGAWNRIGQTLDYSIVINPEGKDLDPLSSVVYLTDEFSYYPNNNNGNYEWDLEFELVKGSVKLYSVKTDEDGTPILENGTYVKGKEVATGWRYTTSVQDLSKDYQYSPVKMYIKLEIPDGTPYILEYQYRLAGYNEKVADTGFYTEISNRIYFNTDPDSSQDDEEIKIQWQEPDASGKVEIVRTIAIYKVDADDASTVIPGTKFRIYPLVYNEDTQTWGWSSTPMKANVQSEDGSYSESDTDYFVTDENGKLVLGHYTFQTNYNTLYKLVEVEPAEGYYLDKSNPPTVKFYFSNESTEDADGKTITPSYDSFKTIPDEFLSGAIDLAKSSQSVTLTNPTSDTRFSVLKRWRNSDGSFATEIPESGSNITFEVVQQASLTEGDTIVNDPLADTVNVKVGIGYYNPTNFRGYESNFVVAQGSTVNLTVTINYKYTSEFKLYTMLPDSNGYDSKYKEITDVTKTVNTTEEGKTYTTFTCSVPVNYDVVISAFIQDNPGNASYSYSVTSSSSGSLDSSKSSGNDESGEVDLSKYGYPKSIGTFVLNAGNEWTWSSTDAKVETPRYGTLEVNGKTYQLYFTYYVKEISTGDWTVYYSNFDGENFAAISSGTITVTNTLHPEPVYTNLTVKKEWVNPFDSDKAPVSSVKFKVFRVQWKDGFNPYDSSPTDDAAKFNPENIPGFMDYNGDPQNKEQWDTQNVKDITCIGEYVLGADEEWTWSSNNLVKYDNKNYYSYFVLEEPCDDYKVTYSNQLFAQNSNSTTIQMTNQVTKRYGSLSVEKKWVNFAGNEVTQLPTNLQNLTEINFELWSVAFKVTTENGRQPVQDSITREDSFTISYQQSGDTPKWTWKSGKILAGAVENGVTYEYAYFVKEISYVLDGTTVKITYDEEGNITNEGAPFQVSYSGTNSYGSTFDSVTKPGNDPGSNTVAPGEDDNTITVTNTLKSGEFTLPQTGGVGTTLFYLCGALLTLSSAVLLISRKRISR